MRKRSWLKLEKVRCLGPGPEHVFGRKVGSQQRICNDCRSKIDKIRYGIVVRDTAKEPEGK